MLEMIYGDRDAVNGGKVLFHGTIDGVEAVITNCRGSHPCAYINIPQENWETFVERDVESAEDWEHIEDIFKLCVHGGVTYSADCIPSQYKDDTQGNWIGWDYAHWGDFTWNQFDTTPHDYEHEWTFQEIYDEVVEAIKELKENY